MLCVFVCVSAAGKFLQALKDFGDVDEESISEAHLRTVYGSVQGQVLSVCVCAFDSVLVECH